VIPAPFTYARPTTVEEALQAVASGGEDVKILAGGQSLIPVMRLRLAAPATDTVADRQVRHRGTFGGALAHADPAGDLPAVALALDAEFVIAGSGGRRTVSAAEFFVD